ncbi:hypothetical protein P9112_000009 [Eukaryota sp. TZLM1-RC]
MTHNHCCNFVCNSTPSCSPNSPPNLQPRNGCLSSQHDSIALQVPTNRHLGVHSISVGWGFTVLLTYSGEVYGWGDNYSDQVLYNGPQPISTPIKLPLNNIISISAGLHHSLALSSEGKLFGWGSNNHHQINISKNRSLPVTPINLPYDIKVAYGGFKYSFALTQEGQVVKWGEGDSFEVMESLNNIVLISMSGDLFVAITGNCNVFSIYKNCKCGESYTLFVEIPIGNHCLPQELFHKSFLFDGDLLFVIDFNGDVWKFNKGDDDVPFNNKPTKVPGLNNIVSISGHDGIYAAIDFDGKVFLWGWLSRLSDDLKDHIEPLYHNTFNNIQGISVCFDHLLVYNDNTVWAWGRNDKGQLGTGDLIDRPQPVKVFGSEILGSFHYPNQPLDSMFSGLIKLVYWEYLNYLQKLFGNHPYTKARFYCKCGVSKRVVQCTRTIINVHPIQNMMFLKNLQDFILNENISDLQLRLSTGHNGPKVINTRIKKLDVYYDMVDHDPQLLSFFPNVEVVNLGGRSSSGRRSIDLTHLSNLKSLELDFPCNIQKLPTSLVKLVLKNCDVGVTDICYLTSLKELVVFSHYEFDINLLPTSLVKLVLACSVKGSSDLSYLTSLKELKVYRPGNLSKSILEGQIPLAQLIARLELKLWTIVDIQIRLLSLKELIVHRSVATNITEQNFPSLKFIQLIKPDKGSLSDSTLSPTKLIDQGLIKSITLIKGSYLVELISFPWWIQYSAERYLMDFFRDYVDNTLNAPLPLI